MLQINKTTYIEPKITTKTESNFEKIFSQTYATITLKADNVTTSTDLNKTKRLGQTCKSDSALRVKL